MATGDSPRTKRRERSHRHGEKRTSHTRSRRPATESGSSQSGSQTLSANALSKLNQLNQQRPYREEEITPKKTRRRGQESIDEVIVIENRRRHKRKKRRVVSGALLEEGDGQTLRGLRGGERYNEKDNYDEGARRKKLCEIFGGNPK